MEIQALHAEFTGFAQDASLTDPMNLQARAQALDFLVFAQDALRMQRPMTPAMRTLQQQAAQLQAQLQRINTQLFQAVRTDIQRGVLRGATLRHYLDRFTAYAPAHADALYMSYDGLDTLIDGLFALKQAPAPQLSPTTDMVHCEETPARVLLALVDQVPFAADDLFYDLGSGLGQVVMLVHLLTGVRARGVEIDPAFTTFAQQQAQALALPSVTFYNQDARMADYSDGTIFFMFTPFRGQLLQAVLARLHQAAQQRPIRLCTFGSCSQHVAAQAWLRPLCADPCHEYKLAIFESLPSA